jgi:hypothetical protein
MILMRTPPSQPIRMPSNPPRILSGQLHMLSLILPIMVVIASFC